MKFIIHNLISFIIIIFLLLSSQSFIVKAEQNIIGTDIDSLSYKEELIIPIDTSLEIAKFQPIDIKVVFSNPCYAKDEKNNSVRVGYDNGSGLNEIESQIYSLEYTNNDNIKSCNVVFLIPKEANGKEKYYVFYDSKEIKPANYVNHIKLEDTHYFYEPISGQKIDLNYYGFWDDGSVIYAIGEVGELLGNPFSQGILKFKPGSKIVETYNIDQIAGFDMRYGINEQPDYIGSAWATSVKKTVMVDGNLMARVRIEGLSPNGDIKTDNIYTYYHSPIEKRRIFADVYHEVLKDIDVKEPSVMVGTYAGIISVKCRSSSIEKMNVGDILPEIVLYNKDDTVAKFEVPQNPSSIKHELILSTLDDIYLGKKAWVCLNDPSTGRAHGIIFESNKNINKGEDGLQVEAWVKQNIKLPGLEADTSNLFISRNSYKLNGKLENNLKKGFSVNLKTVFITVEKNGYEEIDKESEIFQKIIKIYPEIRENVSINEKEVKRFTIKCYVYMAPSIPLGALLSAATGKKISYIYAELYKENNFKSSGSVDRLALGTVNFNLTGKKLIEKIKIILGIFDLRNSSFFKKIVFPGVEAGIYVIKIFRENPIFGKEREYIGFGIIEVKDNTTIRIFCKSEVKNIFIIKNQNDKGISNASFQLLFNNVIISDSTSDENGTVVLKAPILIRNKNYTLKIIYQGFLIDEKKFKPKLINNFKKSVDSYKINLFNLKLNIKDTWGFSPSEDVLPKITSKNMFEPITILSKKINLGEFEFNNLIKSNYIINIRYKSFNIDENVDIKSDSTLEFIFPAEYLISLNFKNSLGNTIKDDFELIISRENKNIDLKINQDSKAGFKVPPGIYTISLRDNNEIIASQKIDVNSDKDLVIVTNKDSFIHNVMIIIGSIIIFISLAYLFMRKKIYNGLKLIVIGLIIISIFTPWWVLNGEKNNITTNTKTYLYPSNMVTYSSSDKIIGGSISALPEEFSMVLQLLTLILCIIALISLITILIKEKFKKTSTVLSIISIIFLILCVGLFYYTLSQVTEIGIGSFFGSGGIATKLPGESTSQMILCNWGPGTGFILAIICFILLILLLFIRKKI